MNGPNSNANGPSSSAGSGRAPAITATITLRRHPNDDVVVQHREHLEEVPNPDDPTGRTILHHHEYVVDPVAAYHRLRDSVVDILGNQLLRSGDSQNVGALDHSRPAWPWVDIGETDKTFVIEVDLPGYDKRDVTVEFDEENWLTIRARKEVPSSRAYDNEQSGGDAAFRPEERGVQWVIRERQPMDVGFSRKINIPNNGIFMKKITAKMDKGVLMIVLPKSESGKSQDAAKRNASPPPKKISVR